MAIPSRLRRTTDQREALLRDLVTDLIINDRITTTEAKAKSVQRVADKMEVTPLLKKVLCCHDNS